MADLVIEDGKLILHLSQFEKIEGVHGDITVPLNSVVTVSVLENALEAVHGFKVGTGIPGTTEVGTFTTADAKTFAVVHHDTRRGLFIQLKGVGQDQWIIGFQDPESVLARLRAAGLSG
ncbi:hypothetical protein [Ferrimicrobium sp.]|uniref:hypothetical protein n=1 Tax=Ferrimicrobium sp. TaxID=2926050 RepID=UPI0026168260|nr:hypothetical protein [Ferrimicrobium sp.]